MTKGKGSAAKSAEMNILTHMQYMHDSKIRPSTLEEMGEVNPEIVYYRIDGTEYRQGPGGFLVPLIEELLPNCKIQCYLDKINNDFKRKLAKMNDKEKMQWKFQRYMQDYLATISSIDDNVEELDYLEENDLEDNTLVVYTSDQGFYLGEHGWYDKRFIYDESFKTPLLIKWPNKIKPGITNDEMVQNLDFAQTF